MKILIGCEFSGIVRRAFAARGHDVWSVDLLPSTDRSNRHIVGDVRDYLNEGWDMLAVFHPPCTRLCNSGVRWLFEPPTKLDAGHYALATVMAYRNWNRAQRLAFMWAELEAGADLFSKCWNADIKRVALENPVMHLHAKKKIENYEPPAQFVQPWHHGEKQFKTTGLYLRGLDPLEATNVLTPPKPGTQAHKAWSKVHRTPPGPNRWKIRSTFFPGIANAMADQWGGLLEEAA